MKKKYGLFKVLSILLLLVVIASYCIKGRQGSISYLALGDVFLNYIQSFYYFFDTIIFILIVGGFYGFLNKVPAYKQMIEIISNKISSKEKEKVFVIIMTIVFALLASLTGLNTVLLLFIPFVVSIILLLGYDKLVALSTTIGGVLVGYIGGIFLTFKDASNQYASSYTTFDKLVGLKDNWSNLFPKILLLVVAVALLIYTILSHIKKNDSEKYHLTKHDSLFIESKEKEEKKEKTKKKVLLWPLGLIFGLLLIILVLGYLPWSDLFGIKCFNNFHTWLTGLKIGKYEVFTSLISGSITAFGTWGNLGNFMMAVFFVVIFIFILMLIYKIKFEDAMDGFIYGMKKMLPAAMIAGLAYCILVCSYNNGFIETMITNASKSFGDNAIINSLITILGSVLNVDTYYVTAGVFTSMVSALPDKANLSVYAVMFQSLYGLVQLIGPTSILLIVGLSYLEVPYKTWLKYIWRFIVELLIIILIVLMIVSLI
mgnify:CR=1 FL=1